MNNLQTEDYKFLAEVLDFRIKEIDKQTKKNRKQIEKDEKKYKAEEISFQEYKELRDEFSGLGYEAMTEITKLNHALLKVTLPLLEPEYAQRLYEIVKEVSITEILSMD